MAQLETFRPSLFYKFSAVTFPLEVADFCRLCSCCCGYCPMVGFFRTYIWNSSAKFWDGHAVDFFSTPNNFISLFGAGGRIISGKHTLHKNCVSH